MRIAGKFIARIVLATKNTPFYFIKQWGHSSIGRASALHAEGQRFDSAWLHHFCLATTFFFCTVIFCTITIAEEGDDDPVINQKTKDEMQETTTEEVKVFARQIDNGSSSTVFNIEELAKLPGGRGDLLSAIQIVSGVSNPQNPGFGGNQGYYIRGSKLTDNQYIIDWLRVGYIFHYGGALSYSVVNSSLLEGFEVILGGFAPKYDNVTGGVIDVRLRDPKKDKQYQDFKFGTEIGFLFEGPLDDENSYWFAFRRSYFDFFIETINEGIDNENVSFQTFPQFYDVQGRLHHETKNGFIDFTLIGSNDKTGLVLNGEIADPQVLGRLDSENEFLSTGMRWIHTEEGEYTSSQYLSYLDNRRDFNIGTQGLDDPNPGQSFFLDNITKTWSYDSRFELYLDQTNNILFGLFLDSADIDLDGYIIPLPIDDTGNVFNSFSQANPTDVNEENELITSQFYFNYRYRALDDIIFSIGFRTLDAQLKTTRNPSGYKYSGFSDRYRLEIPTSLKSKFYVLYGNYVQLQTATDLSESLGNPSAIDLIRSRHTVLGYSTTDSYDWFYKAELWNKFTTGIAVADNSICTRCLRSTAIARAQGIDLEFRKTYSDDSLIYIALSLSSGERKNRSGEEFYPFSGDQPSSLNIAFSDLIYEDDYWVWGMRSILHDGQPYTRVVGREMDSTSFQIENEIQVIEFYNPIYERYNRSRFPLFFQFDLSFRYHHPDSNVTYKIELNSVSDLLRPNISDYDYGEEFQYINNPREENEGFFFPAFLVELAFN